MDDKLNEVLNAIAIKANIQKPNIVCTYQTGKGEGYMGIVKMFEIDHQNQRQIQNGNAKHEGNDEKLHLIVKQSPLSEEIKNRLPVREQFLTEINFYDKIVRGMMQFQREENAYCFKAFANYLYSDVTPRQEMLILENLKPEGFEVLDRTIPMQHEHMKLAFETYAKFHAVSYAMKHKRPAMYEELTGVLYDNMMVMLYDSMGFDNFMRKLADNLKPLFKGTDVYEIYCEFAASIAEEFHKSNIVDEYAVILHGDSWCNNILYKHDASGKPIDVTIIDFQLSKVLSPVVDLSYLFYGCADMEILPQLKTYLRIYHETLRKSLKMFDLDVEKVFSFDKLMEHWKYYGKFGFITSLLLRIIMLSTSDESPDLSEASKKDGDVMMAFMYKMKREEEYNQTIKALVHNFINDKYL